MDNKTLINKDLKHWINEFICLIGIGLVWISPAITSNYLTLFISNINYTSEVIEDVMIYTAIAIIGITMFMRYFKNNYIKEAIKNIISISHTFIFLLPIVFFILCVIKVTFWIYYANYIVLAVWIIMIISTLPMFYQKDEV